MFTKSQVGYNSAIRGADPVGPISTEIGKVVGVHDLIIHSNFGLNIFRGFRSTGGQNFRFPIDFASHRYNKIHVQTNTESVQPL